MWQYYKNFSSCTGLGPRTIRIQKGGTRIRLWWTKPKIWRRWMEWSMKNKIATLCTQSGLCECFKSYEGKKNLSYKLDNFVLGYYMKFTISASDHELHTGFPKVRIFWEGSKFLKKSSKFFDATI